MAQKIRLLRESSLYLAPIEALSPSSPSLEEELGEQSYHQQEEEPYQLTRRWRESFLFDEALNAFEKGQKQQHNNNCNSSISRQQLLGDQDRLKKIIALVLLLLLLIGFWIEYINTSLHLQAETDIALQQGPPINCGRDAGTINDKQRATNLLLSSNLF